jgi:hypothetical protein
MNNINWTAFAINLVAVVGSSALVSGIVTHALENRRYLKKRKIEAYVGFLEQFSRVFPISDSIYIHPTREEWIQKNSEEIALLEKVLNQVVILGNIRVSSKAAEILTSLMCGIETLRQSDSGQGYELLKKANMLMPSLTEEMRNDILIYPRVFRIFVKY